MIENRFIRYLELPAPPQSLLDSISLDITRYEKKSGGRMNPDTYAWSDSNNEQINQWCQENICKDIYWAFQYMTGEAKMHKDGGTLTKMNFIIDCGGNNVLTEFFADDGETKLASYNIEPLRWHIFKADSYHRVINIEPGRVRFAITGRIFG